MRLTKRQLKRVVREEYSKLKRRGLIKEGSWSDDPIEDAYMCVSETCEMEEGSTQITGDLHYVAEQFDMDQLLSRYVKEGEPCESGVTEEKWREFLVAASTLFPEDAMALAKQFSEFWERHYME